MPTPGRSTGHMVALFGITLEWLGRTADQLAMDDQLRIGFKRRLASAFAAVFTLLAVSGAWQAISSHELARLLIVVAVFGGAAAAFMTQLLRRNPVLQLDAEGLTDLRRGSTVRWRDIESAHVAERRFGFERYHDLVLVARRQTVSLSLDQLTRTWGDMTELIEARLSRPVDIRREPSAGARRSARAA
jgi:hypothetical protein